MPNTEAKPEGSQINTGTNIDRVKGCGRPTETGTVSGTKTERRQGEKVASSSTDSTEAETDKRLR